jgi:hypothetical protein
MTESAETHGSTSGWLWVILPVLLVVVLVVVLLNWPDNAAKRAVKRFEFLQGQKASPEELCDAARTVEAAYTDERNAEGYEEWKTRAEIYCLSARFED